MKQTIYTVHAYRWGDRECHSYTVGVFGKKHAALKAAENEEDYRGGKYECEVLEWTLDSGIDGNPDKAAKVIKALPPSHAEWAAETQQPSRSKRLLAAKKAECLTPNDQLEPLPQAVGSKRQFGL